MLLEFERGVGMKAAYTMDSIVNWAGCLIGIHGLRVEIVVGGREISTADVAPCGNLWKEVV